MLILSQNGLFNHFKPSGIKWLHSKLFRDIVV